MIKTEQMNNGKIYELANLLLTSFNGETVLPVKINFYLQKNTARIVELGKEIEKTRAEILDKYGELDEEGQQYQFTQENADAATAEIKDLMELIQEVDINTVSLDLFENIELTGNQMAAISFMIED